jgi:hypothetical protein
VHPFGEDVHYTDARGDAEPAAIAEELRDYLRRHGFDDAAVAPIQAGIEDSFMALMGEVRGERNEVGGSANGNPRP